jgi:flagellar basal-body rod protein FlgC
MASILSSLQISSSGLSVQRAKLNATAQNLANAETTETREGGPYRRRSVVVTEEQFDDALNSALKKRDTRLVRTHTNHRGGKSLRVGQKVELSTAEGEEVKAPRDDIRLIYDPSHPHADAEGYVKMPNIEIITEMVNMIEATRAYEANTVAISAAKQMADDALDI